MNSGLSYYMGIGGIVLGIIILSIDPSRYFFYIPVIIAGLIGVFDARKIEEKEIEVKSIQNHLNSLSDEFLNKLINGESVLEVIEEYSTKESLPKSVFYQGLLAGYGYLLNEKIGEALISNDRELFHALCGLIDQISHPLSQLDLNYEEEILSLSFFDTIVYLNETVSCVKYSNNEKQKEVGLLFLTRTSVLFIKTDADITFLKKHYVFQRLMDKGLSGFEGLIASAALDVSEKMIDSLNKVTLEPEYLKKTLESFKKYPVYIPFKNIKSIDFGKNGFKRVINPNIKISVSKNEYYEFSGTNEMYDFFDDMFKILTGLTTLNKNPLMHFEGNKEGVLTPFNIELTLQKSPSQES